MIRLLRRRLAPYGVDRVLALNTATRGWMLLFGPLTLAMIVGELSVVEQGFHFTFVSLIGLAVFLDMGFTRVVMVFTSHAFGSLRLSRGAVMEGDAQQRRLVSDFGKAVIVAHVVLATVAAIVVGMVGEWMFTAQSEGVDWRGPWWSVAIAASASFFLNPMQTMLEGAGHVAHMAAVKLCRQIATNLTLVGALWLGEGLRSAAWSAWMGFSVALVLTIAPYAPFWREVLAGSAQRGLVSVRDLLSYQFRVAISWASTYFVFSIMTPVAFATLGPVDAARMGLTWQVVAIVGSLAFSIIQARTPSYGRLIAQGRSEEARLISRRATRGALSVATLGFACLLAGVGVVRHGSYTWPEVVSTGVDRMLPLAALAALSVAEVAKMEVLGLVAYVRTFKVEPFVGMFVTLAMAVPLASWLLASELGLLWLCVGYAAFQILSIPWARWCARTYLHSRA